MMIRWRLKAHEAMVFEVAVERGKESRIEGRIRKPGGTQLIRNTDKICENCGMVVTTTDSYGYKNGKLYCSLCILDV